MRNTDNTYSIDLFSSGIGVNKSTLGGLENPYPTGHMAELFYRSKKDSTYKALIHARHPNLANNDIYSPWKWVGYEDIVSAHNNESYFDINDTQSAILLMKAFQDLEV